MILARAGVVEGWQRAARQQHGQVKQKPAQQLGGRAFQQPWRGGESQDIRRPEQSEGKGKRRGANPGVAQAAQERSRPGSHSHGHCKAAGGGECGSGGPR